MTQHLSQNSVVRIPLSKTGKHAGKYVAIVDEIDADMAEHNWKVEAARYAVRNAQMDGRQIRISLHRVIMARVYGEESIVGKEVDHLNGDGFDNRRTNLRVVTTSVNQRNSRTRSTSVYKGVRYLKDKKRPNPWQVEITQGGGRVKHLGVFPTAEDAARAFNRAQHAKGDLGPFSLNRVETRVTQRRVTATPVAIDRRIADRRISQWYTT